MLQKQARHLMLITLTHGLLTGYTAVAFLILILLVTFSLAVQAHVVLDFVYALFTPFFWASLLFYQRTAF